MFDRLRFLGSIKALGYLTSNKLIPSQHRVTMVKHWTEFKKVPKKPPYYNDREWECVEVGSFEIHKKEKQ